jgi:hypothetical protein
LFFKWKNSRFKIFKQIVCSTSSGDAGLAIGGLYLGIKEKLPKNGYKKRYNSYLGSH